MKMIRVTGVGGQDIWIATHDLNINEGRRRKLRPINVFTFLAQYINSTNSQKIFMLCMALENKLYSVHYHFFELQKAIASSVDPIYSRSHVREYEGQQRVIAAIEAYLNAIYTVLELVAQINRFLHKGLPMGFRKQAKKYDFFSFSKWPWLSHFFDVRTELTHFGTPLPIIQDGLLLIDFVSEKDLEIFKKGKHNVPLSDVLGYGVELFNMLDKWSNDELEGIDRNTDIKVCSERGAGLPLNVEHIRIRDVLELINYPDRKT